MEGDFDCIVTCLLWSRNREKERKYRKIGRLVLSTKIWGFERSTIILPIYICKAKGLEL